MQMPDKTTTTDVKIFKEWSELRNSLIRIGYDVIVLPKMQCQEMNLSKQAMLFEDKALVSVFLNDTASAVREVQFEEWLVAHTYTTENHYSSFCGEADTLISDNLVWLGVGKGTNFNYVRWVDNMFDKSIKTVRPIQIYNEHLAVQPPIDHLNQCFCPLANGVLMWYPEAFSQHSQMIIKSWFNNRIDVSTADMNAMACTAIGRGENVIIPKVSNHLIRWLTEFGFNVVVQDMDTLVDKRLGCKSLIINVNE
jgi:N-dimethylarginine dimethylaminohydrolase